MLNKLTQKLKSLSANKISILVLVFWTFASRGLGVIREALTGRLDVLSADMLNSAAIFNETIVTIFILGGIGAAAIPLISKLEHNGLNEDEIIGKSAVEIETKRKLNFENLNKYLSWVTVLFSGLVGIISLVGIIFSKEILLLLNKDFFDIVTKAGRIDEYVLLNQVFLVAPFIFSLKTIFGIFLNSKKAFKIYSLDGVIANMGSILGLSVLYSLFGIVGASWGLVLGFSIALVAFAFDSYRYGFRFNLGTFPELNANLKRTAILMIPRMFLISTPRMAEIAISIFNSSGGSVSTTRMSLNLQGVFYGLMIAVGTVMLPNLTEILHTQGANKSFWNLINNYLKKTFSISLLATFATVILSPLVLFAIKILAFVNKDSLLAQDNYFWQIIILISIGSLAIIPQAIGEIINRYFIAIENTSVPIISSIIGNISSLIALSILIQQFKMDSAYAVIVSFVFNTLISTAILFVYMQRNKLMKK